MSFNKVLFITGILSLALSACASKPAAEDSSTVPEMSVNMPQELPTDSIAAEAAPAKKVSKNSKKSKKKSSKKK